MMENRKPMTETERKDAETMADAIQTIPVDKRERVRDVLFGYRAGVAEGIRIAAGGLMARPGP